MEPDPWLAAALRTALERAGYQTATPQPSALGWEADEVRGFLRGCHPHIVVHGIDFPYESNDAQCEQVWQPLVGGNLPCVLTTTNKRDAELLVTGRKGTGTFERIAILQRPFDLEHLLRMVRRLLATNRTRQMAAR